MPCDLLASDDPAANHAHPAPPVTTTAPTPPPERSAVASNPGSETQSRAGASATARQPIVSDRPGSQGPHRSQITAEDPTAPASREQRLVEAIATIAEDAGPDLDITEQLYTVVAASVSLLDIDTAIMQMAGDDGVLDTVATCGDAASPTQLFPDRGDDGPGPDCFRHGAVISSPDLTSERWPGFEAAARAAGFESVSAVPMRARGEVVGSLVLLRRNPGPLNPADLVSAQALAAVATLTIMHFRDTRSQTRLCEQLQQALDSRVIIEQAKGYLARHHDETPNDAFHRLRRYARNHGMRLANVAQDVVATRLTIT